MGNLEGAIAGWREDLDTGRVLDDGMTCARYGRTTMPSGKAPACILLPETREEVRALVQTARRHGVPLHPISRGRNWGYGDACPPQEGAALVDLSGMARIIEINTDLGYAVVEPGVSQRQLYEALRREAPGFWVDCSAAGPEASVVGNALDRGFGHTPYGDHVRTTCGLEVVLSDGRVLCTGFGHFPDARAAHVYPYGIGPILDGLFFQSNLGIVTRMGVWLYPEPQAFRFFHVRIDDESGLSAVVDTLRPLRLRGQLNSAVHIGNDLRVLSSLVPYPGNPPLSEDERRRLRRSHGLGAWNASGSLSGTRVQVREAARALRRATRGLGKVTFVGDAKLALARRVAPLIERFGWGEVLARQLAALEPNYALLKGVPTQGALPGALWGTKAGPCSGIDNPLDADAGLIWISPVAPLRGEDVSRLLDGVEPLFKEHGFDLPVTFTLLNERSLVGILNVVFDKTDAARTEAARQCYEAVLDRLLELGYPPYRTSPSGISRLWGEEDTFWQVTREIKDALDPDGVFAEGRYIPPGD